MKKNSDNFVSIKRKSPKKRGFKPSHPDFVAPDGGWAWLIAFACGFSNLWIFTLFQQYGLTFVDEFERLQISHSQTTTIFNINSALTAFTGLFNGPIYRKYSYRQVALFGSTLVVLSILTIIWCKSFWSYCIFYGILYGIAIGIAQTANAVALNTYFNRNRSIATGISWRITAIGSIGCPYIVNILLTNYGIHGTLLLFAGFSCHSIICSLLLQPVHWHTKCNKEEETALFLIPPEKMRSNSLPVHRSNFNKFISDSHPFEYIDSSTESINSTTENIKNWINTPTFSKNSEVPTLNEQLLDVNSTTKDGFFNNLSRKFVVFFDLNLLKDWGYLNIIVVKTMLCFVEFNFNIMTPIILKEFHFERHQIAIYLSLVGAVDTIVRFLVPFVTNKFKWNSRVYFLMGSLILTIGRIVLIHTRNFSISLMVAVIIGVGKGFSITYMALVIPEYVPLEKLPAALGIYLTMSGMCWIAFAPLLGIVRDITKSYVTTIHLLNIPVYISTISWIVEYLYRKGRFFREGRDEN